MTDNRVPSEVEAKLLVPQHAGLPALAHLQRLGRFRLRLRDTARLHSIYLDTSRFILAHHGLTLRVRRDAGRWEATVKWMGASRGDVHERPELTVHLPRRPKGRLVVPAGPLRLHLAA